MSKSTRNLVLLALLFWTLVVGMADFFVLKSTTRQMMARSYERTVGRILASDTRQFTMLHAGIKIQYAYVVAGKRYVGHSYRYDEQQVIVNGTDITHQYPQGYEAIVYFNPKNPADSVLSPGVEGADLMLLLFATPVSVALILLWRWLLSTLIEERRLAEAGGLRVSRSDGIIRVRLTEATAVTAAFYGLGVASFAATFPVVVINGFAPGAEPMEWVWMAVLATAVVAALWQAWRNRSGKFDLIIDTTARTLTLPATCGRVDALTLSREQIAGLIVQRRASKLSSGTHYSYLPALACESRETAGQREFFSPWGWTEDRARAFAHWLCSQLALEFKGVEEEC